jgi:hypothetical protein
MTVCDFQKAWHSGPCGKHDCQQHKSIPCVSCGTRATQECAETYGFVCGAPLCAECEHEIAEDGTNGGISKHCRKGEQKYLPWFAREIETQS